MLLVTMNGSAATGLVGNLAFGMLYGPAYFSGRRFCRWTEHMPGADGESGITKVKAGVQRVLCHASSLPHHNSSRLLHAVSSACLETRS